MQQYSFDINRELPGNIAVGFEYSGATGRNLGLGGSNDGVLNINQLDPSFLALGSALTQQVPNPFFGNPAGQGFAVTSPTISRAQSLRPFPQFGNILMRQNTGGKNQYHAAIFKFEKRVSNGWGGRINYTWSRLEDNQFGEGNSYSDTNGNAQNAYDLDAEYALSLLDVPHKLVFSPVVELPFGEGKRWAQSGVGNVLLGGWTLSSIVAFESGFPISVSNNSNNLSSAFFRVQRPNISGDPATSGSREDRFYFNGNPGLWLNNAAYSNPGSFVLGNSPRTNGDVANAPQEQLGLRGQQGREARGQGPRPDPRRSAERDQHGEDARTELGVRRLVLRPRHVAARVHAPDPAHVPHEFLGIREQGTGNREHHPGL